MNLWHDVAPHRVRPEDFLAVIEIEKGSKNKYEMDKETGALRRDHRDGPARAAGHRARPAAARVPRPHRQPLVPDQLFPADR